MRLPHSFALAAAFLVCLLFASAWPTASRASHGAGLRQCFYATADTYADSSAANSNYGSQSTLLARQADQVQTQLFLTFDLSTIPGNANVLHADLQLYQLASGTAGNYPLYAVSSVWLESTLTWNNRPANTGIIYDQPAHDDQEGFKTWNAANLVQNWVSGGMANRGVMIAPAGFPNTQFVSSEGVYHRQPRLCVEWNQGSITTDLIAEDLEVTQAVQDLQYGVRLVAGKPTFVRLHVRSTNGSYPTYARLVVGKGSESASLSPINQGAHITVQDAPDRGVLDHAFLFRLPDAFTTGSISLFAQVNPDTTWRTPFPPESTYTNNWIAANVSFEDTPAPALVVYRGRYSSDGTTYETDMEHVFRLTSWLRRAFPVPTVDVRAVRVEDYGEGPPDCDRANLILLGRRILDLGFAAAFNVTGSRYYALVDDGGGFMRGCSFSLPASVASGPAGDPASGGWAWDTDSSYGDWYGGHELAHTYGRPHAEFCGAGGGQPYPYPAGRISPTIGDPATFLYGFDAGTQEVYDFNWRDVMTYCNNQWIGDFTYHALLDYFQNELATATPAAPSVAQDRLVVLGTLLPGAGAVLEPIFTLPGVEELLPRQPGPYDIVLRTAAGVELARYPFTPRPWHAGPPAPGQPEAEIGGYFIAETVPAVAGTDEVAILGPGGTELGSLGAGSAPPTITLLSPNGGENLTGNTIPISWSASDPDGDPLTFHIQYSPDNGASWEAVAVNLTGNSALLDRTNFTGSDEGLVRVWVSDGLRTAYDQSNAVFRIPTDSPIVEIVSPQDKAVVAVGQTVTFEARVYDPDTGLVDGEGLRWVSVGGDGLLGSGARLSVSDLSEGEHTIALAVTDGQDDMAVSVLNLVVVADPTLLPPAPHGLQVGPSAILLEPELDTRAIHVTNQSGPVAINWQATVGVPWLMLSAASGATPATLQAGYDDAGLAPGLYTGTIAFTSSDVPGQQVSVPVTLFLPGGQLFLPAIRGGS
jgi:hypothetical protein